MENQNRTTTPTLHSLSMRMTSVMLAVVISVGSLLGFSLLVDLKPAKAVFGIDAAIQIAFEFVKAIAKQFILRFIMRFVIKLLQKLESIHVIRNFLAYADALGLDQYVARAMDGILGLNQPDCIKNPKDPKCKEGTDGGTTTDDPSDTNAVSVAEKHKKNPLKGLSKQQIEKLAQKSKTEANTEIQGVDFFTNQPDIKAGEESSLSWGVTAASSDAQESLLRNYAFDIKSFIRDDASDKRVINSNPGAEGSMRVKPDTTTVYEYNVYRTDAGRVLVAQQTTIVKVDGAAVPRFNPETTANKFGLTKTDEKRLLRGAIATLVTAPFCGGVDYRSIRNVAVYEAAKARGPKPDPRSRTYYRDQFISRNPLASDDFQDILLRDNSGQAQAEAKRAVNHELTGTGTKALRGAGGVNNPNGISRTSQTIADKIETKIEKMLNINQDTSNTAFIGKIIGDVFANMIVDAIFKDKGRVVREGVICASAKLATSEVYKGADTKDLNNDAKNTNVVFTVNGQSAVTVKRGEAVTVLWDVANAEGTIEVLPKPSAACVNTGARGACTFNPTSDAGFQLRATTSQGGLTLGQVSVVIDKQTTSFDNPEFEVSPLSITAGKEVSLSWTVRASDENYQAKLNGSNVDLVGTRTEQPSATKTYTFEVFDTSTGKRIYVKAVTVEVKAGP